MKNVRTSLCGIAVLLCIALPALAANTESVRLSLNSYTVVNGVTLKPGDYQLNIDKNEGAVKVTFLKNKKEVATANGTFVSRNEFVSPVSTITEKQGSTPVIREIWVAKIKGAIVLDQTGSGSSSVSAQ